MSKAEVEPVYYDLVIVAASPTADLWLDDDDGHLVMQPRLTS